MCLCGGGWIGNRSGAWTGDGKGVSVYGELIAGREMTPFSESKPWLLEQDMEFLSFRSLGFTHALSKFILEMFIEPLLCTRHSPKP